MKSQFQIAAKAEKGKKNRVLPMAPEFAEFLLQVPETRDAERRSTSDGSRTGNKAVEDQQSIDHRSGPQQLTNPVFGNRYRRQLNCLVGNGGRQLRLTALFASVL